MDILSLPGARDIFFIVFSHLSLGDLINLKYVCKELNRLVRNSDIWKKHSRQLVQAFTKYYQKDKILEISNLVVDTEPHNAYLRLKSKLANELAVHLNFYDLFRDLQTARSFNMLDDKYYKLFRKIFKYIKNQKSMDFSPLLVSTHLQINSFITTIMINFETINISICDDSHNIAIYYNDKFYNEFKIVDQIIIFSNFPQNIRNIIRIYIRMIYEFLVKAL